MWEILHLSFGSHQKVDVIGLYPHAEFGFLLRAVAPGSFLCKSVRFLPLCLSIGWFWDCVRSVSFVDHFNPCLNWGCKMTLSDDSRQHFLWGIPISPADFSCLHFSPPPTLTRSAASTSTCSVLDMLMFNASGTHWALQACHGTPQSGSFLSVKDHLSVHPFKSLSKLLAVLQLHHPTAPPTSAWTATLSKCRCPTTTTTHTFQPHLTSFWP